MEVVLDHYANPRNYGELELRNLDEEGENPFCGDRLRLQAYVNPDGVVESVRFTGSGCTVSVASASLLTTFVEGLPIEQAIRLPAEQIIDAIATPLSPRRAECVELGHRLLRSGLIRLYHARRMWIGDENAEL